MRQLRALAPYLGDHMIVWIVLSMDGDQRRVPSGVLNAVPTEDEHGEMHRNHRLDRLFADFINEPVYGYMRLKVTDARWAQNGKTITLMRSEIDILRYVEPEDVKMALKDGVPTAAMTETSDATRGSMLEFEQSMEKKED